MKIISNIINAVITIIVIAWISIFVYDYIMVSQKKSPKFCIKEETREYSNGTTYVCTGVGYKYINHNRSNYKAIQFGGFWIKEKVEV